MKDQYWAGSSNLADGMISILLRFNLNFNAVKIQGNL